MTKRHKINLGISVLFLCILIWLYLEIDAKKKAAVLHQAAKDQSEKDLLVKEQGIAYWQSAYYSQANWSQQFQHIPNPGEAVAEVIIKLTKLKEEIFNGKVSITQEIDGAIHALKGEKMQLSFTTLAKIIENLLEIVCLADDAFNAQFREKIAKRGIDSLNFGDFMKFVEKKDFFTIDDLAFLKNLQDTRNACVHQLSPQLEANLLVSLHLKSIEIIEHIVFQSWFAMADAGDVE